MKKREQILSFLNNFGIDLVGVADLEGVRLSGSEITKSWSRAIVFGYILSREVLNTIIDRPTLIYKHHYKTVNWILDQAAERLAHEIERSGTPALAIPASQTVDRDRLKGHISHRHLARLAGLGFLGRSGLLINPEFGAGVRYISVLTDLGLEPDKLMEGECGGCQKCIVECPAQAVSESGVDLVKCYEKLKEFAAIPGIGQNICGVCVKVCI